MHDVLTEHEAAAYLRVTVAEVVTLLEAGEIRGRRIGASWRVHRHELEAWFTGESLPSPVAHSPLAPGHEREKATPHSSIPNPQPPVTYTPAHLAERIRAVRWSS